MASVLIIECKVIDFFMSTVKYSYVPSLCSSPEKATSLGCGFGVAFRSLVLNINMSTSAARRYIYSIVQ